MPDVQLENTKPFNLKQVIYEVLGPVGAVADIGYFDVDAEPQHVGVGCRIVVDGASKAESVSSEVNAYTHRPVKSA